MSLTKALYDEIVKACHKAYRASSDDPSDLGILDRLFVDLAYIFHDNGGYTGNGNRRFDKFETLAKISAGPDA